MAAASALAGHRRRSGRSGTAADKAAAGRLGVDTGAWKERSATPDTDSLPGDHAPKFSSFSAVQPSTSAFSSSLNDVESLLILRHGISNLAGLEVALVQTIWTAARPPILAVWQAVMAMVSAVPANMISVVAETAVHQRMPSDQ
jgi:hypothetical protein